MVFPLDQITQLLNLTKGSAKESALSTADKCDNEKECEIHRDADNNLKKMNQELEKQVLDIIKSETDAQLWTIGEDAKLRMPIISYQLIINDLQIAVDSIKKAVILTEKFEKLDDLIVSALWTQAIMRYSRCFKKSDDGYSSLEPEKYIVSNRSKTFHSTLISIRDSFLAHRGKNDFEHHMVVATLLKKSKRSYQFNFQVPSLHIQGHFIKNHKSIIKHIETLQRRVSFTLDKKCRALDRIVWNEIKT